MDHSLKLLIVYDSEKNEYSISDHNLDAQKAEEFIRAWQAHLRAGCNFIALDQKRVHKSANCQDCRTCRDLVKRSSGLQPQPKFKKEELRDC